MKIKDLDVGQGIYLAPMAGYTDKSFRRLCKRQGADVLVTEMVSAKALSYHNQRTFEYLGTDPEEKPVFLQLFGNEPALMAEMAALVQDGFAGIDINMGCPAPKVFKNHEGSSLLKEPDLIYEIVHSMVHSVHVPVTVKIRKGIREDDLSIEAGLAAQEGGAAVVAFHARTAAQMYHGHADWEAIARLKEKLNVPVVGNGDIKTWKDALQMKKMTGCDGLMIGRAARGNPWLFRQIQEALQCCNDRYELSEEEAERIRQMRPGVREVCEMVHLQAQLMTEHKGERTALQEMRAHIGFYSRGFRGSARLRSEMQSISTMRELDALLEDLVLYSENSIDN